MFHPSPSSAPTTPIANADLGAHQESLTEFVTALESKLSIRKPEQWYDVSREQLKKLLEGLPWFSSADHDDHDDDDEAKKEPQQLRELDLVQRLIRVLQ